MVTCVSFLELKSSEKLGFVIQVKLPNESLKLFQQRLFKRRKWRLWIIIIRNSTLYEALRANNIELPVFVYIIKGLVDSETIVNALIQK